MVSVNFLPILAIIIGMASFILFLYFNFELLQPTVSFFVVMTLSLTLGVMNTQRWTLYVGPDTSLVVIGGMFAFSAGAVFVHYCYYSGKRGQISREDGTYNIPYFIILACTLLTMLLAFLNGKELYNLSVQLGNQSGVLNMVRTLRYPIERGEIHFSRWISYRNMIAMIFATSFLYFFLQNLIIRGKVILNDLTLMLPVIASVPFFVMSTGRRSIVHFVICGLILSVILYQRRYGSTHAVKLEILKMVSATGMLSIGLYFVLGFLTGKVSLGGRNPLIIISHYGGLSVPALEQYVSSVNSENQYFLQNTMMGIYGNLNTLGAHLELGRGFLPFVEFQGTDHITTNVYTVFYRLLADYSFPGLIIIMFLFGILLTYFYDYLKHSNSSGGLVIYSYYGYIPFFLFIDDQFMGLFTTRTIYFCILLAGLVYYIQKKYYHPFIIDKNKSC